MVYVLTLVAAAIVAAGEVIQQRLASRAPPEDNLSPRLLLWLARQPRWLAGVGCSLAGNLAFASALNTGGVVLVEAVFVSRLLFGLTISALWGWHRVPARDIVGGGVIAASIVVFLVAAGPQASGATGAPVNWLLGAGAPVAISLVLALIASRLRGAPRASLLGAGAGILFGLQAALVQSAVHLLGDRGILGLLGSWHGYAVVAVALLGMLLVQSAFESSALRASYPAVVTAQLLCALGIGIWVLGSEIRLSPPYLYALVPALAAMIAGIVLLTRSSTATGHHPDHPAGSAGQAEPTRTGKDQT